MDNKIENNEGSMSCWHIKARETLKMGMKEKGISQKELLKMLSKNADESGSQSSFSKRINDGKFSFAWFLKVSYLMHGKESKIDWQSKSSSILKLKMIQRGISQKDLMAIVFADGEAETTQANFSKRINEGRFTLAWFLKVAHLLGIEAIELAEDFDGLNLILPQQS